MSKAGYVYIMASGRNGTIYTGVTSDLIARVYQHRNGLVAGFTRLIARVYQHRNGLVAGFTRRYGCTILVWFEAYDDIQGARARERQLKKWNRQWKLSEIEKRNPEWSDLYPGLLGQ